MLDQLGSGSQQTKIKVETRGLAENSPKQSLNAGLTISRDVGFLGWLNKIRAEVLHNHHSGEGFYLTWKPRCLGALQLSTEETRDM